jgi:hypothetical protein
MYQKMRCGRALTDQVSGVVIDKAVGAVRESRTVFKDALAQAVIGVGIILSAAGGFR